MPLSPDGRGWQTRVLMMNDHDQLGIELGRAGPDGDGVFTALVMMLATQRGALASDSPTIGPDSRYPGTPRSSPGTCTSTDGVRPLLRSTNTGVLGCGVSHALSRDTTNDQ
jgi:hypothetical protein